MTTSKLKRIGLPTALVVGGVTAGSFLAPIGLAAAQEADTESDATTEDAPQDDAESNEEGKRKGRRGHGNRAAKAEAVAETLGLSSEELRAGFAEGKTLADMAGEQGVSEDDLKAALTDAAGERLDAAVEAGRLTEDEAAEKLAEMESRLDTFINTVPEDRRQDRRAGMANVGDAVEETLGLTREEIHEAKADGQTLSDLADAQGVSAEDLAAAMIAAMEENIDEAVAEDRIDEDKAAELREGLDEKVEDVINGEHEGRKGRGHGPRGPRGDRDGAPADADSVEQSSLEQASA